jgi:hypothetical protein
MNKCQGFCCYDGVYLNKDEEEKLKNVIRTHRQDFSLPIENYFENGNWHNKVYGIKTAVRPFKYLENFPNILIKHNVSLLMSADYAYCRKLQSVNINTLGLTSLYRAVYFH